MTLTEAVPDRPAGAVTPAEAEVEVDVTVSGVTSAAYADVAQRIARSFPHVPTALVGAILGECFRRGESARVQNFRLVLAERDARRRLASLPVVVPGGERAVAGDQTEPVRSMSDGEAPRPERHDAEVQQPWTS